MLLSPLPSLVMPPPATILGLNAWHGDASACVVVDGELVAAAEEERFRRTKHWAGFPAIAARWCLETAGVAPADLAAIAVNRDPSASRLHKAFYALKKRPSRAFIADRLANSRRVRDVRVELERSLNSPNLAATLHHVEHHRAHLASSFLVSPFEQAAVVSIDGFGDFASSAWGLGQGHNITIEDRVRFPHSLGLLYLAVTQFLGFHSYGDEYKLMGLAGWGKPRHVEAIRKLVRLKRNGRFALDLRYFRHHDEGVAMRWDSGAPVVGQAFSSKLEELLGPARLSDDEVEDRHADLAASLQAVYEETLFHVLRHVAKSSASKNLALSGGCAMNSAANGRILDETPFEQLYVPPAPGDAGGAVGAALSVWCETHGAARQFEMRHAYLGPECRQEEVQDLLQKQEPDLTGQGFRVRHVPNADERCHWTAERIAAGGVIGWFQNRMEWGPRALGNRSILADPRRADMRELLNVRIKLRERFRPFAPSVLSESAGAWFERSSSSPFMQQVWRVRDEKRSSVPAITHVDGTGRVQTVDAEVNPLYHRLLSAFETHHRCPDAAEHFVQRERAHRLPSARSARLLRAHAHGRTRAR